MDKNKEKSHFSIDKSAIFTVIGIILLFSTAIITVLIVPVIAEKTWTEPSSHYQKQMYEVADPNLYISNQGSEGEILEYAYHLKNNYSLLSFQETSLIKIVCPPDLEQYITRYNNENTHHTNTNKLSPLKLSSRLLLLRDPINQDQFKAKNIAQQLKKTLQNKASSSEKIDYTILELFDPQLEEAFALAQTDGILENWVDENYQIIDKTVQQDFHKDNGVIYVSNPQEFRVKYYTFGSFEGWKFDKNGEQIKNLEDLKGKKLGFLSRKDLIEMGEDIYKAEGCWYCHTDQTRTLIQDLVLNGSESEPAPPSSSDEYVYQRTSFVGTRRIGPDISRVGIKKPSRDWHKAHFWSPKTESKGSIMPSFQHFFDNDPRGTSKNPYGVPNVKFEAVFQYLMTKGTRITAPTQAWWLGKDPVQTKALIEGRKSFNKNKQSL